MLGMLRSHDVNLNFIQSRPSRIKPGDYLFFLELTGHPDDANVETSAGRTCPDERARSRARRLAGRAQAPD